VPDPRPHRQQPYGTPRRRPKLCEAVVKMVQSASAPSSCARRGRESGRRLHGEDAQRFGERSRRRGATRVDDPARPHSRVETAPGSMRLRHASSSRERGARTARTIAFPFSPAQSWLSRWRRESGPPVSARTIATPRKGASAPTDADDRFDDSRHRRRTLASNGKQASVIWSRRVAAVRRWRTSAFCESARQQVGVGWTQPALAFAQ
jgi:hypothetical protein